ncbi:uncharacterized protein LOC131802647 [Musca domestica]|uniref:Uncharacterized protein LOC131802647 n=1 Tax=Musca domestica TaxID=7370 RepID=A0ABM3UZQ1_MUSDO|nr:uncharacterized protein LOC131802647 [Musca domestica]
MEVRSYRKKRIQAVIKIPDMAAYLPNQDCRLDDRNRNQDSPARPTARSANRPIWPIHRPSSTSPERRQRSRSDARPRQRHERPSYWPILKDPTRCFTSYALADPDPRGNSPIDVELGADTYSAIRKDGCTAAGIGDVLTYNTQLGYVFAGPIKNMPRN